MTPRPGTLALLLALAAGLAGCPAPARTLDDAALRDMLRRQGLDELYDGAAESGLTWQMRMWARALSDDPQPEITEYTYLRRGEPLWEDAGWQRLVAGMDSSLHDLRWRPSGRAPDDNLAAWQGDGQRVVLARYTFDGDSTGYFVTAAFVSDE